MSQLYTYKELAGSCNVPPWYYKILSHEPYDMAFGVTKYGIRIKITAGPPFSLIALSRTLNQISIGGVSHYTHHTPNYGFHFGLSGRSTNDNPPLVPCSHVYPRSHKYLKSPRGRPWPTDPRHLGLFPSCLCGKG